MFDLSNNVGENVHENIANGWIMYLNAIFIRAFQKLKELTLDHWLKSVTPVKASMFL